MVPFVQEFDDDESSAALSHNFFQDDMSSLQPCSLLTGSVIASDQGTNKSYKSEGSLGDSRNSEGIPPDLENDINNAGKSFDDDNFLFGTK